MTTPSTGPDRHRSHARARGAEAYTAIEVLMALTMMAIGAAAVMSMQKASVQGNLDARRSDVATAILQLWVDRLHKDAMAWTLPSPANPSGNNISGTTFVKNVTGAWAAPTALVGSTPPISPAFDILGRDLSDITQAQFCVHVRLSYLYQDTTVGGAGQANSQNNLIRADVRVLWARSLGDPSAVIGVGVCDPSVATDPQPSPQKYQSIYATTAIRQNGAP